MPTDNAVIPRLRAATKPISLRLHRRTIRALKAIAKGNGIGYQTLIKQVLATSLKGISMKTQPFKFRYWQGVKYVAPHRIAPTQFARCLTCFRAWDDERSSTWTPTPSGRCPFEYWHKAQS